MYALQCDKPASDRSGCPVVHGTLREVFCTTTNVCRTGWRTGGKANKRVVDAVLVKTGHSWRFPSSP